MAWKRFGSEGDGGKRLGEILKGFSFRNIKKDQLLILFLAGVLLLVISLPTDGRKKSSGGRTGGFLQNENSQEENMEETMTGAQDIYLRNLENRLSYTLSQMSGVGEATVMITLSSSAEKVVEKDVETSNETVTESDSQGGSRTTKNGNRGETTIYNDKDSSGAPYISKELSPKVEGVIVIAEGGDDALVKQNITEAVQALFGIDTHKIRIMKKSSK